LPWTPAYPEFAQHFEYRIVDGTIGAKAPLTRSLIRAREPGAARDAGYVARWDGMVARGAASLRGDAADRDHRLYARS